MWKEVMLAATLVVGAGTASATTETYNPYGPQNGVLRTDVTEGGWTQVYSGSWDGFTSYDTMFNNLEDWVMLASGVVGSDTFHLLAAIRVEDFNALPTGWNETETHNGAEWYRNGYSLGFAPEGATIDQWTADTVWDAGLDQRMSWHTSLSGSGYLQDPNLVPTYIGPGYRSGGYSGLDWDPNWQRFVFTASDADLGLSAVPLPASAWLLMGALGGLGALSRRRKSQGMTAA